MQDKTFFTVSVVKDWKKLPIEVMECPSLKILKSTGHDPEQAVLAGGWTRRSPEVSFKLLPFCKSVILWIRWCAFLDFQILEFYSFYRIIIEIYFFLDLIMVKAILKATEMKNIPSHLCYSPSLTDEPLFPHWTHLTFGCPQFLYVTSCPIFKSYIMHSCSHHLSFCSVMVRSNF